MMLVMAEVWNMETEEKSPVAKREEEILALWSERGIFKKTLAKPAPKGEFVFYDGPPFATGLPHYGHVIPGTIKDVIPRYRTMRGYHVRRKWGWDCHGLPLEAEVEKELGLKTKRDIEQFGVGKFNQTARGMVMRYADEWKKTVPRLGRWVDMEDDYRTMDAPYTETVWWIFKTLYDKGLIYKGYKTLHLSPLLGTELSNFEVAQEYRDIKDIAVYIKLKLHPGQKYGPNYETQDSAYLVVWTTTPWTLPGNMAAAIHKDATYVAVRVGGVKELLIIAKDSAERVLHGYEVEMVHDDVRGKDLVGLSYDPPFDYWQKQEFEGKENAWKIYHADYVELGVEGTGAVHLAPAFGAEDLALAQEHGIPIVHHVEKDGTLKKEVRDFAGLQAKPKDNPSETDAKIAAHLDEKGLLFKKEKITHSYPHSWRTDEPLLNYAMDSWFVKATALKEKLISENNRVHWVPPEIGRGRFGEWLQNVRDWSISRSRYWGAPLPVWESGETGKRVVIGSVNELKTYMKRSGNAYFVMRHGEAKSNAESIVSSKADNPHHLTEKGKQEVRAAAEELLDKNIELIITSPFVRTQETARMLAEALSLSQKQIITDERIREVNAGTFNMRPVDEYRAHFVSLEEKLTKRPPEGENILDVRARIGEFIYDIEQKYQNKTILIVTHEYPVWMLEAVLKGADNRGIIAMKKDKSDYVKTAEVREYPFVPIPHNELYELDLHRPYIDDIELADADGMPLKRIPDVFDCWYESGAMPYASHHYPFENTDVFEPKSSFLKKAKGFPADFISESIDQTRGWFYSLLVLSVGLFGRAPYRHVITNGIVLAEDGRKMSKRLKNYPEISYMVNKYGADAIRYYLLSSPLIRGGDLNFSERGVGEVLRKHIMRFSNVVSFYELYKEHEHGGNAKSAHVLDRWMLARLNRLIAETTDGMEAYELDKAVRPIADFVDDLSTWYLRRSRERFKGDDMEDRKAALGTLQFVLAESAKVVAPVMPFFAEDVYRRSGGEKESVHLEEWPRAERADGAVLADMREVREVVAYALDERSNAGVRVRQPLQKLIVQKASARVQKDGRYHALIRDEVNVKEVVFDENAEKPFVLDTTLTDELREEGHLRELVRSIQDVRKKNKLTPDMLVELSVQTDDRGKAFITKWEDTLRRTTGLSDIQFGPTNNERVLIDDVPYSLDTK